MATEGKVSPDIVQHILNVVEDDAIRGAIHLGARKVAGVISWARERSKQKFSVLNDERMMQLEEARSDETIELLSSELQDMARTKTVNWRMIDENASEPAFADFVYSAMNAAVSTTLESKRAVFASLIARRLEVRAESAEEILLRRASEIAAYLSEDQLRLLAAILLVQQYPTDTPVLQFATRDEAEAWLRTRYFKLARGLRNSTSWTTEDFEMLVAMGAIRITGGALSVSASAAMAPSAPRLNEWLIEKGVPWNEGLEGPDITSEESRKAYARRYPTISLLSKLAAGQGRAGASYGFNLEHEVQLTPVGEYLALIVYERLTQQRLRRVVVYARGPAGLNEVLLAEPKPEQGEGDS